jgi:O-acetyl-ADP-ribose deacetylase
LEALVGDITKPKTEAIVSVANGVGIMGRGVAGAITEYAGPSVSREARELVEKQGRPYEPGEVYVTKSGRLTRRGVKSVYHAVTMKFPGGLTSVHIVNVLMRELLSLAIRKKVASIAFPGLGTGVGRLDRNAAANVMTQAAKQYDHMIEVKFIDHDPAFIKEVNRLLGRES